MRQCYSLATILNGGATVTGNVTDNGALQFNQSAGNTLTISNLISGSGRLLLTNTGTLNLTGTTAAANTVVLDMHTSASAGMQQIRSGTGTLRVGSSGSGTLVVDGGSVAARTSYLGYADGSLGTATVSSGTWATSAGGLMERSSLSSRPADGGKPAEEMVHIAPVGTAVAVQSRTEPEAVRSQLPLV